MIYRTERAGSLVDSTPLQNQGQSLKWCSVKNAKCFNHCLGTSWKMTDIDISNGSEKRNYQAN
jgi:hypothetical protein